MMRDEIDELIEMLYKQNGVRWPNHCQTDLDPLRYAQRDANKAIPTHLICPSYTEYDFEKPQTVYLKAKCKLMKDSIYVKNAVYEHSDTLISWYGFDKHMAASEAVDKSLPVWSPVALEQYLRGVMSKPKLELVHVMSSWNAATLNPYQVYGYIDHKE